MGLRKGQTNNPAGRRPGALNKMNQDLRQSITEFLEGNWPAVEEAFGLLNPKDKVTFYKDLLQYRLPKLESISIEQLGLDGLTEEQLDQVLARLKKEHHDSQSD